MSEIDKRNMASLKDSIDRLLKKLESKPAIVCVKCGVEWNKLYEKGLCIECVFWGYEKKRKDEFVRQKKSSGLGVLNEMGLFKDDGEN